MQFLEEPLFLSEKCHLKPQLWFKPGDEGKLYFKCLFTGEKLERAYVINKQYGSFADPIIASTYLRHLHLNGLIEDKLFDEFIQMISLECLSLYPNAIKELIVTDNPSNCTKEGTWEYQIYQRHKEISKSGQLGCRFDKVLYRVEDLKRNKDIIPLTKKKTTGTVINNKRKLDQDKKISCAVLYRNPNTVNNNNVKSIETFDVKNNDYHNLPNEGFLVKSLFVDYTHGCFHIYLSDTTEHTDIENCNTHANNLMFGSDKQINGNVLLISTKSLYPDGTTDEEKTKNKKQKTE